MQNNINRASQFQPFDALKGFREALKLVEQNIEIKKEFSDDLFEEINKKLKGLNINDKVLIEYYYDMEYIEIIGVVKKIDSIKHILYLENTKISFDDIMKIDYVY